MFVQIEFTIKTIVYVQFSNDIGRTERYHAHFSTCLFIFWGGSCDVK